MGDDIYKRLGKPTTEEILVLRKRGKVFGKRRKKKDKERNEIEEGLKEWEEENE